MEATTNTWAVVALLEPFVAEVVVSNPLRTRAIATAKIKTDRVDALVLAQLLRSDFLPRVWQPDADTRRRRALSTERANLVSDRTRLKNRIHAVLHQRLIEAPAGDLFQPASRRWLRSSNSILWAARPWTAICASSTAWNKNSPRSPTIWLVRPTPIPACVCS